MEDDDDDDDHEEEKEEEIKAEVMEDIVDEGNVTAEESDSADMADIVDEDSASVEKLYESLQKCINSAELSDHVIVNYDGKTSSVVNISEEEFSRRVSLLLHFFLRKFCPGLVLRELRYVCSSVRPAVRLVYTDRHTST